MADRTGSPYQFDELGWLQFQRLARRLLAADADLHDLPLTGRPDRLSHCVVAGPVRLTAPPRRVEGPVLVAVAWLSPRLPLADRPRALARRLAPLLDEHAGASLIIANIDDDAARSAFEPPMAAATVLGERWLGGALDRHPAVRTALPSVLGHRDLTGLISARARGSSTLDVESAQELARVFWPTRAYEQARRTLDRHRFVVLTGPPEMGKSAIARMLALAAMTDGWEAFECSSPEQLWRVHDPRRRQVFVADDAFGSTEYRPEAAERWAESLARLLSLLDDGHRLIWTSRPAPLRAGLRRVQRERHAERFPAPGQVLVDASELDLAEKTLILFRHAKARGLDREARELVRGEALTIVEHPHFTPERIRRLVAARLPVATAGAGSTAGDHMHEALARELAVPTEAMRTSLRALGAEHRDLLIALLDAPGGLIDERALTATVRRHHPMGLSRPPHELIDRLTDHFLRVTPLGIGWVHPSWRDLVIDELRADPPARERFLARCGFHGAALALSTEGGPSGGRRLPLLVGDGDWSVLAERMRRLAATLEDHELLQLLIVVSELHAAGLSRVQQWEASELARDLLEAIAERWRGAPGSLSPLLFERWCDLRALTGSPIATPPVARTWAELYPASEADLDRDALARLDEWLALAETLARHDPEVLTDLGFFDRDTDILARLVITLPTGLTPQTRPLGESILGRIAALTTGSLAGAAHEALRRVTASPETESRWWVPEDLPAPPSTERVARAAGDFTVADVDRVLADL